MDYRLRRPRPEEVDDLYGLHRESMGAYVEATWGPWEEADQRARFLTRFEREELQVVCQDGAAVGILEVTRQAECYFLDNIQLCAAARGRGLGSRLVRDLMERAAAEDVPLCLTVLKVNPARGLYQRLGFREVGETETHYQMEWKAEG